MAVNRKPAAPVKAKVRKNHGPKRKMFHCWDSTTRIAFAKAGVLDKYTNYESFVQACGARGVRTDLQDLWFEFVKCGTCKEKDEFFKNIQERVDAMLAMKLEKQKKMKKALAKVA